MAIDSGIECLQDAIGSQELEPLVSVHPALLEAHKVKIALLQAVGRHEEAFGIARDTVTAAEDIVLGQEGSDEEKEKEKEKGHGRSLRLGAPGANECLAMRCVLLGDALVTWGGKKKKARRAYEEALLT